MIFNDGEAIERQNSDVTTSTSNKNDSQTTNLENSASSTATSSQVTENSTGMQNESELGDNIINVENDCPNRKLCDNFDSVSPTTTETITKTPCNLISS